MPSTCVFEFDRPDPVYYSGETINGRIQLHTTTVKSVKEVYILFKGEASVRWEERRSRRSNNRTEHYTEYFRANESYLNTRTRVFPPGELPPGTHTYTFCIPLPPACPTSCTEKYGHISYEISLVLNRPFRFDNVFKQPLTVLKQFDLNYFPDALIPLKSEDIKYFCCWPCSSGPLISVLTLPFGGYAPGQSIKYKLEIDNQSSGYDLDGIELQLKQVYTFIAHSPRYKTREHTNTLTEDTQANRCLRFSKRVIEGSLVIPPVPPTMTDGGIISVRYYFEMFIKTGDCHTDSEVRLPIIIGTVPLAQSATNPANAAAMNLPTAPYIDIPAGNSPDLPPSYDFYKPPSFEQATNIGEKFKDPEADEYNRTDDFIPKYPMYTNFSEPTAPPSGDNVDAPQSAPLLQSQQQSILPPPYPVTPPTEITMPPYPVNGGNMPSTSSNGNDGYGWRT
ncbi:arrestin domain-containing protein 3 [Teleopsis dalmanni]|uniref:arrestin domain-containing protein 3 n=1 Tax=Teleopsis dalmanni TaxID=139649 RepID=UPI0018CCCF23|nr:arrestin domain-containing protein 3 [Teleopsis dalmanni]